jgi:hypothetical protein
MPLQLLHGGDSGGRTWSIEHGVVAGKISTKLVLRLAGSFSTNGGGCLYLEFFQSRPTPGWQSPKFLEKQQTITLTIEVVDNAWFSSCACSIFGDQPLLPGQF